MGGCQRALYGGVEQWVSRETSKAGNPDIVNRSGSEWRKESRRKERQKKKLEVETTGEKVSWNKTWKGVRKGGRWEGEGGDDKNEGRMRQIRSQRLRKGLRIRPWCRGKRARQFSVPKPLLRAMTAAMHWSFSGSKFLAGIDISSQKVPSHLCDNTCSNWARAWSLLKLTQGWRLYTLIKLKGNSPVWEESMYFLRSWFKYSKTR